MLESGRPVDDEEVKEIFDDEAISRKLNDLCAFLFTVEESKEVPMPEIYGEQDSLEDLSLLEVSANKFLEQNDKYSYRMPRSDGACLRVPKETRG